MKLRRWERDVLRQINGKKHVAVFVDGATARKLGEMTGRLGVRGNVFIGNDIQKRMSVVVDPRNTLEALRKSGKTQK